MTTKIQRRFVHDDALFRMRQRRLDGDDVHHLLDDEDLTTRMQRRLPDDVEIFKTRQRRLGNDVVRRLTHVEATRD